MVLTKIGASLGGSADTLLVTQAGHGFVANDIGKAVKMLSTGLYALATADAIGNADVIGIILQRIDANTLLLALSGRVTVDAGVPTGDPGTVLFLPLLSTKTTNVGYLNSTEPSSAGEVSKPMAVITISGSEMILFQMRGEVISSGAVSIADDSIVEAKLDVSNAPADGQFLQAQSGEGGGLTWAAAGGASTTWISAGEFIRRSAPHKMDFSGTYQHMGFVGFEDGLNQRAGLITLVPGGKTGISSIKVFYLNDVASKGIAMINGIHLLTENASATDNNDSTSYIRYVTSSTTGLIEAFTVNSAVYNNITTFAAGEILTFSIWRVGGQSPVTWS